MDSENTYYVTKGDKTYGPYQKGSSESRRVRSVLKPGTHSRFMDHLKSIDQSESDFIAEMLESRFPPPSKKN